MKRTICEHEIMLSQRATLHNPYHETEQCVDIIWLEVSQQVTNLSITGVERVASPVEVRVDTFDDFV